VKKYDVVIVGGGPAGVQAAVSARNTNPDKSIALVRKEQIPLIPCGIPYVFYRLKSVDDDILQDTLLQKNKIDILTGEVIGREAKTILFHGGERVAFDKLVLATGSIPITPQIPGRDKSGVYVLTKDYKRLVELRSAVKSHVRILIVGGGYVGAELADELLEAGKSVVLVERLSGLLPRSVDPEFGNMIQQELQNLGAEVITGTGVKTFEGKDRLTGAVLENGRQIHCDIAIVSVGFKPNTDIAQALELDCHPKYGILVDEYMRTSDSDVFAVGDCAAKRSCYTGQYRQIMLASTAMSQGRLAGSNLFSINVLKSFPGTLGSFATKAGNMALGVTGLTETEAKEMGLEYVTGTAETVDRHPGSLPGASKVFMKLIFARYSRVLLGAQITGGDSVGECINMLSVMIQKKMTDIEIDTLQIGTHPLLTPSPLGYAVITATVDAITRSYGELARVKSQPETETDMSESMSLMID